MLFSPMLPAKIIQKLIASNANVEHVKELQVILMLGKAKAKQS